jgi:hypothetical protein
MLFRAVARGGAIFLLLVSSLVAPSCAGCGSSRASFDGTVYKSGLVAFQVPAVPPAWRKVDVTDAALAFRDDAHEASVMVNGRCAEKDGDAPLLALTNQLVMGTTDRDVAIEETLPFDAREARHTKMNAKLDGVMQTFDIFVMKKDGCVYDFVYVGDPGRAEGGVADFERFVRGFHTMAAGS